MKKRKFSDGGGVREGQNVNISDETRAKALAFVRQQDEEGMQELLRSLGEGPAASRPAPVPRPRLTPEQVDAARRRYEAEQAAAAPKPSGKPSIVTDTGDETARLARRAPVKPGMFVDSDEEERSAQRARDEEENESRIRQARYRAQEKEQALEPVQPETILPMGKAAKLAQVAAGAAANRGARADAKNVMEAANRRAAQTRAERAETDRPATEIMRSAAQSQTARRAAETRERAQRKLQEVMGRGSARLRRERQPIRSREESTFADEGNPNFKRGGKVGGGFSKASSRADGIAKRGKTRGRIY